MKNIKKLLDINLNKSEIDKHMSEILKQKFDSELKDKYVRILETKYNVKRTETKVKRRLPVLGIAASLILLIAACGIYFFSISSDLDYQMLTARYDSENPFIPNEITRGNSGFENQEVLMAYETFDKSDFDKTKDILESAPLTRKADIFLLGYVQFKTKDYKKAISSFDKVISMNEDNSYHPEARFYKIVSLYASGQAEDAKRLQEVLAQNSWEYKELQKIFK